MPVPGTLRRPRLERLTGDDPHPDPHNLRLPKQRPIVNVVAVFLVHLSLLPLSLAQRLTRDGGMPAGRAWEPPMPEYRSAPALGDERRRSTACRSRGSRRPARADVRRASGPRSRGGNEDQAKEKGAEQGEHARNTAHRAPPRCGRLAGGGRAPRRGVCPARLIAGLSGVATGPCRRPCDVATAPHGITPRCAGPYMPSGL